MPFFPVGLGMIRATRGIGSNRVMRVNAHRIFWIAPHDSNKSGMFVLVCSSRFDLSVTYKSGTRSMSLYFFSHTRLTHHTILCFSFVLVSQLWTQIVIVRRNAKTVVRLFLSGKLLASAPNVSSCKTMIETRPSIETFKYVSTLF